MDMGLVRGIITAVLLVAFIALSIRVYLAGRRGGFDDVAALPLDGDDR
ncbi:MAG: CcoQ/FixQ family Cbb3-type cytochrome c oxidase assembly chaperone [Pseudomonadota bacterium]